MVHHEGNPGSGVTVTHHARERLASWGLSEGTIADLAELTGKFDYSASGNASRITDLYSKDIDGLPSVIIAGLLDPLGIGPGGDCLSLASHFHFIAETSGLAAQVRIESSKDLLLLEQHGRSRDFFARPRDFHVWSTLVPKKKELGNESFQIKPSEGVVFDPSFREVSTIPENRYKTSASIGVETPGVSMAVYADPLVPRADIDTSGRITGIRTDCGNAYPILGISGSKRLIHSLLFVNVEGAIIPVLGSIRSDSRTEQAYYLNLKTGDLESPLVKKQILLPEEEAEIREILEQIGSLPIRPAPENLSPTDLLVKPFAKITSSQEPQFPEAEDPFEAYFPQIE